MGEAALLDWFQLSSAREGCTLSRLLVREVEKVFLREGVMDSVSTGTKTPVQPEGRGSLRTPSCTPSIKSCAET
jgi:hypothetical protein